MYRKPFQNHFYGDDPRWFVGVVETPSIADPPLGRVRVRVYGLHSNSTADIDTDDLPLAQVMIPGTEEGTKGLGMNAQLEVGAMVFGIFLDGKASQLPFVLGSFPRIEIADPAVSGSGTVAGAAAGAGEVPLSTLGSTTPPGEPLTQAEEDALFAKLEEQEAENRAAAGLPREFSQAERNAIKGILASEGGNSAANLATMLNRSYQSGAPIHHVVFATKQFTPATSALLGYTDVLAGIDDAGFARFRGGYENPATANLRSAVNGYGDLPPGINYFNSAGISMGTLALSAGNDYYIGAPGNFSSGGAANYQLFLQRTGNTE